MCWYVNPGIGGLIGIFVIDKSVNELNVTAKLILVIPPCVLIRTLVYVKGLTIKKFEKAEFIVYAKEYDVLGLFSAISNIPENEKILWTTLFT
jgi:hypothetical protein